MSHIRRYSPRIIDIDPISITKHQVTCVRCNKHRLECECTCAVCLDAPLHACHFECAVPSRTLIERTESASFAYLYNIPVANIALESAQGDDSTKSELLRASGAVSTTRALVSSSKSAPLVSVPDANNRPYVETEKLVPNALRKKSVFSRLRLVSCVL
jgi:hypothetical protein